MFQYQIVLNYNSTIEICCLLAMLDRNCLQIPPAPPRPDFDASREKLQRLGEGESTMTKDEFLKMKQELEQ